jgi:hypothetical protein
MKQNLITLQSFMGLVLITINFFLSQYVDLEKVCRILKCLGYLRSNLQKECISNFMTK